MSLVVQSSTPVQWSSPVNRDCLLGLGWFTAVNPRQLGYLTNYSCLPICLSVTEGLQQKQFDLET